MTVFRISANPTDYGPDCTDGPASARSLKRAIEGHIKGARLDCEVEIVPDSESLTYKSTGDQGTIVEICTWLEPRWQSLLSDEEGSSSSDRRLLWEIWAVLTEDEAGRRVLHRHAMRVPNRGREDQHEGAQVNPNGKPDTEFVSHQTWDSYARRIERENLNATGTSLTAASISRRAKHHILDVQTDQGGMIVTKGWRKTMRREPK